MSKVRAFLLAAGFSGAVVTGGALVADSEDMILQTYLDPVGIKTACFGYTGPELNLGQRFTEQQCLNKLAEKLGWFDNQLQRYTYPQVLTDGERAAYLSFVYNVGTGNFSTSTLRKKLLSGDRVGACNELPRWVYAKGIKLKGLVIRREKERKLCLSELTQ